MRSGPQERPLGSSAHVPVIVAPPHIGREGCAIGDGVRRHEGVDGYSRCIARPGEIIGYVGVPHGSEQLNLERLFRSNIALRGGVAPVRAYLPELLADVLARRLDPSPVLDLTVDLDGVPSGYAAMDQRTAMKVMVLPQL